MRKLIIGIVLLLVAVLCLSNLSRISDAAFDKFFEDDSTSNTGNNTGNGSGSDTGNNSGEGSGDSSNGDTPGDSGESDDLLEDGKQVVFEPLEWYTEKNYVVDHTSYEKCGDFYYYPAGSGDYYVKTQSLLSELAEDESLYLTSTGTYLFRKTTSDEFIENDCVSVIFDMSQLFSCDFFSSFDAFNIGYSTHKQYFCDEYIFKYDSLIACEYSLVNWDMDENGDCLYLYAFVEDSDSAYVSFFVSTNSHSELTNPVLPSDLYLYSLCVQDVGVRATPVQFIES